MKRLRLLLWSLRYSRPRQLFARLRLLVRRRVDVLRWRGRHAEHLASESGMPAVRAALPLPLFAPRTQLAQGSPDEHTMVSLEVLDDVDFASAIETWVTSHPPFGPDYWRGAWSSHALSLRVVVWMQQIALRRGTLAPGFLRLANRSLVRQLRFLERNLAVDLGGNRLIKNAKALLWAARYFTGPEADRWAVFGARHLMRQLREQILIDGMHFERSPSYHAQVFADLCECALIGRAPEIEAALAAMAAVLVDTTHPDGLCSQFGDGGLHMAYSTAECLAVYERLGGQVPPTSEFVRLSHAGYYGLRCGEDLALVDCGAIAPDHVPAHGHGDALSFEWSVSGQRMIVDAGVLQFEAGGWRDWSRATSSHNTVTVDDADQCEFWGVFRMARRATVSRPEISMMADGLRLTGKHDGFARLPGRPIHRRTFDLTPGNIGVHDAISGGSGQPVQARLLVHPEARVTIKDDGVSIERDGAHIVLMTEAGITLTHSWWCPDFGERHETTQIVLDYGNAPCAGGFAIRAVARMQTSEAQSSRSLHVRRSNV